MKDKEKLILMYKDLEVLSFEVDYFNENVTLLERLEHFDLAPYGTCSEDDKQVSRNLTQFFRRRQINIQRRDSKKIFEATNSRNGFELSFKAHGLSLTNHYWFKREGESLSYENINFFSNKWDDSFARAVLNEDYEALKKCDLNVPDIVTPGFGVKGRIYDNGPKLYKLGIGENNPEEAICEALASKLANRLFDKGEAVQYELKMINGKYASVSSLFTKEDEEVISLSSYLSPDLYTLYKAKFQDKYAGKKFYKELEKLGMHDLLKFFIKLACFCSLGFVYDLHFGNISLIKNNKTGEIRVAPLYDLGGAFGSTDSGKTLISKAGKGLFLIVYYLYNDLDPEWDYSWYDPSRLIGFEDEIRSYLSKSNFYTKERIDCVIEVYHQQKKVLDEMAKVK